jgi:phosphate transport system permease protein
VIAGETFPLFRDPVLKPAAGAAVKLDLAPLAFDVDEYRRMGYAVVPSGIHFFLLGDAAEIELPKDYALEGAAIASVSPGNPGDFAFGLSDGRVMTADVGFLSRHEGEVRKLSGKLVTTAPVEVDPRKRPVRVVARVRTPQGGLLAAAVGERDVVLLRRTLKKNMMTGKETAQDAKSELSIPGDGEIRALAADTRGDDLYVGTSTGRIVRVDLRKPGEATIAEEATVSKGGAAVTVLGFLLGDRTLVAGDATGAVSTWQPVRVGEGNRTTLQRVYDFEPHKAPVSAFAVSRRDKGFVTMDASGAAALRYGTTGATLLDFKADGARAIAMAPKSNGLFAIDAAGKVSAWDLHNPHPEVSFNALFGKVWYEGYEKPEYVWQSTGGTDDFEAKFSLTPLIYGTLKGTAYAMLFAVPISLLAALFVSQFMHPNLKSYIKPVVEIMAALPSVVLGFIAGLWLAPRIEMVVPAIFVSPLVMGAVILVALAGWRRLPPDVRKRFVFGSEVFLLVPVIFLGAWLSGVVGGWMESGLFAGDYRTWLNRVLGLTYDQRNCVVVGLAMGFAVIPVMFTIAEDSLSNVPEHLSAGSLALGASRWQTAIRVVLPTASPGIFSAVMIGFGRAVGETMIVLMATGNTPVMNASVFSGFRALSANIAVELPEAPEQGTLFRVLFLAAFLLFIMTFVVNTAAELIRIRLRKRFQGL